MAAVSITPQWQREFYHVNDLVTAVFPDVIVTSYDRPGGDYIEFVIRQRGTYKEVMYRLSNTEKVVLSPLQIAGRLCDVIRASLYKGETALQESVNEVLTKSTGNEWVDNWLKKQEAK